MIQKKLNVACGSTPMKGYVNFDIRDIKGVDVVGDARKMPFKDNNFDEIVSMCFLEHLSDKEVYQVLSEMHRTAKPNAIIKLLVPHFKSFYSAISIQHKTFYCWHSPEVIIQEVKRAKNIDFTLKSKKYDMIGNFFGAKIIQKIASIHPRFYERFLSGLISVDAIEFEMEAKK
ncbi:MAG: methyltransferase domain-containing protein [archaeon]